jgi:hypothetical protein
MKGGKPAIAAVLVVALGYFIYPYFTLYQLGQAIRGGDAAALQSMVDWPAVREGIKEDICDQVVDEPQDAKNGGQLPPFGAGFVRGITTNVVDARVTPEALVAAAAAQERRPAAAPHGAAVQVKWAFFTSPAEFAVDLATPGQVDPIRLQMTLRDGAWYVTRVWLPPELLGKANPRT